MLWLILTQVFRTYRLLWSLAQPVLLVVYLSLACPQWDCESLGKKVELRLTSLLEVQRVL